MRVNAGEDFPIGIEFEADDIDSEEHIIERANELMGDVWVVIEKALRESDIGLSAVVGNRYNDDLRVSTEERGVILEPD